MVSRELLVVTIAVEVVALAVALAVLLVHGGWLALRAPTRRRLIETARGALQRALTGEAGPLEQPAADLRALGRLRPADQLGLLAALAPALAGEARRRIGALAASVGQLGRAERLCRSRRWRARLRGARLFTLLGGGTDVMPSLFDDRHPLVRAQAAEWAAEHPEPEVVARLVAMLDDEETLCRFTVRDSLLRLGRGAVEPLAGALEGRAGAAAREPMTLAAWMPDARFLPAALRLAADRDPAVRAASATVLGGVGGDAAHGRLLALLSDPEASVRAAATSGLGRLGAWTAAPSIAVRLRDPAWDVRRAAGVALSELGGPGRLLLQRALRADDPFAADMARHVLDLEAVA